MTWKEVIRKLKAAARRKVNLVTAAALVGRRTSVRKAASSRAVGRPRKTVER